MNHRVRTLLCGIQQGHTARRVALLLLLVVSVLAVVGLVLLSPLMMAALNPDGNTDWQRLADIAQTYGAASAVLALLALGGVAVSLMLQAREMRAARIQAARTSHMELMKLALENPAYLHALGESKYADDERRRQAVFVNLLVTNWELNYEMHEMNDVRLRAATARLFTGEVGRQYWVTVRDRRISTSASRRTRRFHQLVDEEYRKATAPPPAEPPEPAAPEQPAQPEQPDLGQ